MKHRNGEKRKKTIWKQPILTKTFKYKMSEMTEWHYINMKENNIRWQPTRFSVTLHTPFSTHTLITDPTLHSREELKKLHVHFPCLKYVSYTLYWHLNQPFRYLLPNIKSSSRVIIHNIITTKFISCNLIYAHYKQNNVKF